MTLHYPGCCPILSQCLRHLRQTWSTANPKLAYEDEHERADALEQQFSVASGHPDYVRLRGFLAIEQMVGLMEMLYQREKLPAEDLRRQLKVAARSWEELTENKRQLVLLLDQMNLSVTEAQLGGSKFDRHRLVLGGQHLRDMFNTDAEAAVRTDTAARLRPIIEKILHSILVFRPYLRNPDVSVGVLGDDLCFITQQVYGAVTYGVLLELTQALMDVKL